MSAILKNREVGLRPMRDHDLAQVAAIEQRSYEFPWSLGIFSDCLRVGYCCWTLADEETVVGYGIMAVAADEAHILNICIDPGYRRLGLAGRLLAQTLALARSHQATIVFLEVRPSNTAAQALYRAAGFQQLAVRRNYYPAREGREDALVLGLRFDGPAVESPAGVR